MKPILEIQNISKKYQISHQKRGYLSFRERMVGMLKFDRNSTEEDFWALNNVSFVVEPGESIGIIGRNGAGKSTLLKILSKITPPTKGRVISRGRIASLLEVGTGFHQELTGRENIFFNGSLLGMKRKEIESKFDEIIDFSGVEKFLDTPLKHYSSGMQLRLAFAVAAFLEPEILIIDEVLAVGDAEFQKKCIGKMEDVTQNKGRTILFVSHNMNAIKVLCRSGIHLSHGASSPKLKIDDAISTYSTLDTGLNKMQFPIKKENLIIHNFQVTQSTEPLTEFSGDNPIDLLLDFQTKTSFTSFRVGFHIRNQWGELMTRKLPSDSQPQYENIGEGRYLLRAQIPQGLFTTGNYTIEAHASIFGIMDFGMEGFVQKKVTINSPSTFNRARPGEVTFPGYIIWPGEIEFTRIE